MNYFYQHYDRSELVAIVTNLANDIIDNASRGRMQECECGADTLVDVVEGLAYRTPTSAYTAS